MISQIPFDFVFDYLPDSIVVKKMFGMHYIYLGRKLMLMLRKRNNEPGMNGIWVATNKKHHQSLKADAPGLAPLFIDDDWHSNWLQLKDDDEVFEDAVIKVCELISRGDPRLGRFTKKPATEV
jgi:hypothetical protein